MIPFDSGTRILPTTLGTVLFSLVAGVGVAKTGYYTPFMIVGAALLLIGASLVTTWEVHSPPAKWVGYQLLFGAAAGLGIQQAHTAAQTEFQVADVPTGAVVVIFSQISGGTIWLSVAQNILPSQLLSGISDAVPTLDAKAVLDMGATGLRDAVEPQPLGGVLKVYSCALTMTLYCGVALAAVSFLAATGIDIFLG